MLSDDRRIEPEPRPAAEAEADNAELVRVRVHPAAIDAEARCDLAGGEERALAGRLAPQEVGDLVCDCLDGGWIERRAHVLQVAREAG